MNTGQASAYLVVINGKPSGPYSLLQLKEMNISPQTFVKAAGMDDFKEAQEVKELCDFLGFAMNNAAPQYYATLDTRLLAVVIDYLLIFGLYALSAFLVNVFISDKTLSIWVSVSGLAAVPLVKAVYAIIMEASDKQGTMGKIWLSIKVTDEEGLPIGMKKSFIRNISKILSFLSLGVGYFIGFFHRKQKCLHDRIAGTLVIRGRLI